MSDHPDPAPLSASAGLRVLVSNRQDLPVDEQDLVAVAERTLRGEGVDSGELSLSLVGPREMEELHIRYLDEPGPTDVLSFPMDEDGLLGDVVVCPSVAAGQARENLASELRLLVAHGVLHLLGYDHEDEADRLDMWARQDRYSARVSP
jgi:probable rRNA maturation factor